MFVGSRQFSQLQKFFVVTALIGAGLSYSYLYLFHIVWAAMAIAILSLWLDQSKSINLKLETFDWAVISLFLLAAMSGLWAINGSTWIRYLFYSFIATTTYLMIRLVVNTIGFYACIKVIRVVYIVQLVISVLEALSPFRWPISPYSSFVGMFGRAVDYSGESSDIIALLSDMPTGFQWNPNALAFMVLLFLPLVLVGLRRSYAFLILLLAAIVVYTSGSRLGLLVLGCLFVGWGCFFIGLRWLHLLFLACFLAIIDFLFFEFLKSTFYQLIAFFIDMASYDVEKLASIGIRVRLYIDGWFAFIGSNGAGLGAGGLLSYFEAYGGYGVRAVVSPHNYWLELLVDMGVLGLIAVFVWGYSVVGNVRNVFKRGNALEKSYSTAFILTLWLLIPAGLMSSSLVYNLPFWVFIGLVSSWRIKTS